MGVVKLTMLSLITPNNYQQHRQQIKSGDLLAWSTSSAIGRLIRMWTGQTYSHVGIAWVVGERVFVIEAMDGIGVRIMPLSDRLPFYHISTIIGWTNERETLALSKVGERYSYLDAIRAGLGIKTTAKGWQCAEFAAMVLGVDFEDATPGEIVERVLS